MIDILIFLIWGIEGAMLYVNIMVKSSDILKLPATVFSLITWWEEGWGGGGLLL